MTVVEIVYADLLKGWTCYPWTADVAESPCSTSWWEVGSPISLKIVNGLKLFNQNNEHVTVQK